MNVLQQGDEDLATKGDVKQLRNEMKLLEQRLMTAMNRRALALFASLLAAIWGLLELYL